ncbi:MAG: PilZ domain-containing protein [Candidatus Omnitrophica bacterium]|nr:PilZ domain-containing protein [Candidatus Omnitrophota bacterium]
MVYSGVEKRKSPRVRMGRVEISTTEGAPGPFMTCEPENVSVGGLCVRLDRELKLFTGVHLRLFIDNETPPIECKGKINWTMALASEHPFPPYVYETGIEFVHLNERHRKLIMKKVDSILNRIE